MKLKELLPHLCFLMQVKIVEFNNNKDEEILFTGLVDDVPWRFADMELDTDDNGEAIYIPTENDKEPILNIYVRMGEE